MFKIWLLFKPFLGRNSRKIRLVLGYSFKKSFIKYELNNQVFKKKILLAVVTKRLKDITVNI